MKNAIQEKAYAKYQLMWMLDHGHSLKDIYGILKEAEENCIAEEDFISFAWEYFMEHGFDGEIFACYEEFLDREYMDVEKMIHLLSEKEFIEYAKERKYEAFELFTVTSDGTVTIQESNYMTDNSVTDRSEETSRIVECSGAVFNLRQLSGRKKADEDFVEGALSSCKQYTEDVTDEALYDHLYDCLKRDGVHIGDYYDKNIMAGEYIKLF